MLYKIIQDLASTGDVPQAISTDYFNDDDLKPYLGWKCPDFKITHKGKVTDYIFSNLDMFGFLISHELWEIISSFKISEHQRFDVNVIKRGKVYKNYHYIHWEKNESVFKYIDWEHSILHKYYNSKEKLELMHFNSYKELEVSYQRLSETNNQIGGVLSLKNLDYDLINFRYSYFPQGVVCSEKCKEALENAKLTGFMFESLEQFK
jgi:hypothetical protein